MLIPSFVVSHSRVSYEDKHIVSVVNYESSEVSLLPRVEARAPAPSVHVGDRDGDHDQGESSSLQGVVGKNGRDGGDGVLSSSSSHEVSAQYVVRPVSREYKFVTERAIPRLGLLLVGLAGNNGTTVVGSVLANKHNVTWRTKNGVQKPNYYGSLTQASTCHVGRMDGEEVYCPFRSLLPMVNPNDLEISGWDISDANMADAMERARVLDYDLQRQLRPMLENNTAMPGIYNPDFIAANQEERANHVIQGTKKQQVEKIREDIRNFKQSRNLDKVIVLWTANTERFSEVSDELHGTKEALLASIERDEAEIAPSTLYAVASILEDTPYINGSPQNTFVPGLIDLAVSRSVLVAGDDFKSGQTKMKSVLVDFLVGAGIKPVSIVSYNHLGNNDGKNLSAPQTFRSKEISKSSVVDDMVASNEILYQKGESPDHCIVIKYIPYVGDSKRAMDEYTSEIFMGGTNTIVMHNTCEDSLLASPLILDLVLIAELCTRIQIQEVGKDPCERPLHPVCTLLSYLSKAPLVPRGVPVVNALAKQRAMLENFFRACIGLSPEHNMMLEFK